MRIPRGAWKIARRQAGIYYPKSFSKNYSTSNGLWGKNKKLKYQSLFDSLFPSKPKTYQPRQPHSAGEIRLAVMFLCLAAIAVFYIVATAK